MSRFHMHEWDMLPEHAFRPRPGGGMTLEGGKGGNVPAPDPELVKAQIKSMGIQDQAIQEILANSESLRPLQEEQMRFGIDASKAAFDQSTEDRDFMLSRRGQLSGIQDQLISDANSFNTDAKREELAGKAVADVSQAFSSQRDQTSRQLGRMGINPSSGRYASVANKNDMAEAAAKAGIGSSARAAARAEGMGLKTNAANMLAGYPSMGMQATGNAANFGAAGLGIANTGLTGMNAGMSAAGGMAGQMGQNATSMYGQQMNAYLKDQQSGDSLGGILGGLGGVAMGLGKSGLGFSDRRLKQDIVPAGKDEVTGLNLYEFAYSGDAQRRFIGVMADEVEALMPDAVIETESGYKAVDYDMLGIEMKEVA